MKIDSNSIGVYCITNIVDNKKYVGQTYVSFKERCCQHFSKLKLNKHGNTHLQDSWNKYGKDNFVFEILEVCDKELLDEIEIYWISKLKTMDREYGYNLKDGGLHGLFSNETKLKISISKSGENNHNFGVKFTKEHRDKISISTKGNKHYMFGKNLTKEHKLKISIASLGRIVSESAKANISKAAIGKRKLNNTSGYTGVYYVKSRDRWCAQVTDHSKTRKTVGYFKDKIVAAKAYDTTSWELYGNLDLLNFPENYSEVAI